MSTGRGSVPSDDVCSKWKLESASNLEVELLDINIISLWVYNTVQKYSAVSTSNTGDIVAPRGHALSAEARLVYGVGVCDEVGSVVLPVTFVGTDKLNF